MNKLNTELIEIKKRIDKIEELRANLDQEYDFLQNKLHLYFDSPTIDTTEAEKFIINHFWQNAYEKYADGGYITNDLSIRELRFPYECLLMEKIIKKHCKHFTTALEIGCGNGDTSKFLAKTFSKVLGVDFSKKRIKENIKNNTLNNLNFSCQNAFEVDKKYDFVFLSDVFMYTPEQEIKKMFKKLMKLLNKDGILLIRDSTKNIGEEEYKSKNYVAYYRNYRAYIKDFFKPYFIKKYRNYGYNMYHLNKYFSVFGNEQREKIKQNPFLLEDIVKEHVEPTNRTSHFYVFSK